MNVGFNHNVMYKGEVFHIQTEDSGVKTPHIITLLYRGGTIISSKKTSYADIIKMENLGQVVEELMKEQHKDMLRRLKGGEFDDRAFPSSRNDDTPSTQDATPATAEASPQAAPATQPPPQSTKQKQSLDEIILDYLVVGDDK